MSEYLDSLRRALASGDVFGVAVPLEDAQEAEKIVNPTGRRWCWGHSAGGFKIIRVENQKPDSPLNLGEFESDLAAICKRHNAVVIPMAGGLVIKKPYDSIEDSPGFYGKVEVRP